MPSQPNMIIELCDKICDQHIRDDDNSYREEEFNRVRHISDGGVYKFMRDTVHIRRYNVKSH